MDRRLFLKSLAGAGLLSLAGGAGVSVAAREGGPGGAGGPGKLEAGGDYSRLAGALEGFSATLIKEHLAILARYKAELKEVEGQDKVLDLAGANPLQGPWRSHVLQLLELQNGVRLHECYFSALTPRSLSPGPAFIRKVESSFGSFDQWWVKFRATSLSARAWGTTGWDTRRRRLVLVGTDTDLQWPVSVEPVLVVDMAEHAYCLDYPGDPYKYLESWLARVNWEYVEKALEKLVS